MKCLVYSLGLVLLLTSCVSVKTHNETVSKLHNTEALKSDVDAVYKQLQKHHPRLYQYTPKIKLDKQFDSLKATITTPMTSQRFFEKLAPVLTQVRQGHVSSMPPNRRFTKKERKALRKQHFEFNDLGFEYLDHKLLVEKSEKDSLLIGSEVLKMETEPAANLIKKYQSQFASDGFNTTLYDRYVGARFTGLYYRDKGFLDSLSVTFKKQDSMFTRVFRRIAKDSLSKKKDTLKQQTDSIKIKKPTKQEKQALRIANKQKRKRNKVLGYEPSEKNYNRNLNFIESDSAIAIMKIRSFTNGDYKTFYKESFAKLDTLNTKFLVLDLRDNGGGRIAEIAYLFSFLAKDEFQFITPSEVNSRVPFMTFLMSNSNPLALKITAGILAPFIVTHNLIKTNKVNDTLYYNFKYSKIKTPNPQRFKGKLYVLINGSSFSASSIISTQLQANNLATFVGEETGGAYNGTVAGIYKIYTLPTSKIKVRMGLMQIQAPFKTTPDGYGVIPDKPIVPTQQDRVNALDPEMEWILKDIKQLKN